MKLSIVAFGITHTIKREEGGEPHLMWLMADG
jgi:hypothetical protein